MLNDGGICCLQHEKAPGERQPEDDHHEHGRHLQQNAHRGKAGCLFLVFCTEAAGDHRVDADGGAGGECHHDVLHRKCQRYGGERRFTQAGDIDAVDDVVKRLHEHGCRHWQCHADEQAANGRRAHLVFLGGIALQGCPLRKANDIQTVYYTIYEFKCQ